MKSLFGTPTGNVALAKLKMRSVAWGPQRSWGARSRAERR